jgi:hypothetical protein
VFALTKTETVVTIKKRTSLEKTHIQLDVTFFGVRIVGQPKLSSKQLIQMRAEVYNISSLWLPLSYSRNHP